MLLDPHAMIHMRWQEWIHMPGSITGGGGSQCSWILMPGSMRWLSMLLDPCHARIHEVALNALGSTCQDP